jgi:hypothetical protein
MSSVLELMEKVGSRDTKKILSYIDDAFLELESHISDVPYTTYIDVTAGVLYYSLPTDMVDLLKVRRAYDSSTATDRRYIDIPRVIDINLEKQEST